MKKLIAVLFLVLAFLGTDLFAKEKVTGKVFHVSSIWTGNGDGYIIVESSDKKMHLIKINGSAKAKPTEVKLKTKKYLTDAVSLPVEVEYEETKGEWIQALIVSEVEKK